MAVGQGLRTLLAAGVETTWGTPVPVTRRFPFLAGETLRLQKNIITADSITGGPVTFRHGADRRISSRTSNGDIPMALGKQGMGIWFNHALGGTSTVVQQGATPAWLQTHQTGTLTNKGITIQKVIRDGAGTVVKGFVLEGCKIPQWSLSVAVGEVPRLTVSVDAENMVSGGSTAVIEGLGEPVRGVFTFQDGAITIAGTPVAQVLSTEVTGTNPLDVEAYFLGSTGLKGEPELNDFRSAGGTLTARFLTATLHDLFEADTGVNLILNFTGSVISGSFFEEVEITIPEIRFDGETPAVGGVGPVEMTHPFTGFYDGTNNPIKIEYMSRDTTVW
jgi:hypothetical protein